VSESRHLAVVVEADGGSRGNPGPAGYGAVVRDAATGEVLAERSESIGITTNNVAEYQGLIAGLTAATDLGAASAEVRMDSKLVVEQMNGRWQVKHPSMRPLARQAAELARRFDRITFDWIPREHNKHADRLANAAMDAAAGKPTRDPQPPRARADSAEPLTLDAPTPQNAWIPPDSTPTRLILLRHGATAHTLAKRFAGRSDLDLADAGRNQAARAAERLAELGPIEGIVSSPLRRARQTAQVVAERLGIPVEVEDGFVEADFGDWDGLTYSEAEARWAGALLNWMNDPSVSPPGGESLDAVTRRVRRARDRILSTRKGQRILVVSHVTPIKVLTRLALDAPPHAVHRMFLEPASITVIDYYPDGPVTLRSFNDAAHLNASRVEQRPATN
jgi:ribonuclease H / adenosylcobalamin/alpha-ribazole phosphatase